MVPKGWNYVHVVIECPRVSKAVLTEWQQQNMYSRLHLLTSLCFRWPHQSQLRGQIMHTRLVLLFDRSSVPRVGASIAIKTTQLLGALLVLCTTSACLLACWLPSQCSIVSFVPPCRSVHVLEYTTCENTLGGKNYREMFALDIQKLVRIEIIAIFTNLIVNYCLELNWWSDMYLKQVKLIKCL